MKKIVSLMLLAVLTLLVTACAGNQSTPAGESSSSQTDAANSGQGAEIALITDLGGIDDKSFNQGSWEGVAQYAAENNLSHKYYKPAEQSDDSYLIAIDLAVKGGAKVIVTPGFLFETPIFIAQDRYPDVHFILVDGSPHNADSSEFKMGENTVGVHYAEEQAGFLAGYAAVKDGLTKLGFMGGMAVPAVVRFGYGYVQGAEYAAREMDLPAGTVSITYHYTGAFEATPEVQSMAASWYNDGVEVIFSCGGPVGNSVMAAAEQAGAKVIGVDIDQSNESKTVITSATKGLTSSVYTCIKNYYEDPLTGGQNITFTAENDGVELPMETSRFEKFSQQDYEKIYDALRSGTVEIMSEIERPVTDISVEIITLTVI